MPFDEEYFNSEEFRELLDSYEASLDTGQQPFMDASDLVDIADYYNFNGDYDKAVEAVERALDLYPHATLPNVFKARQALAEGNFERARQYAENIENKDEPDYCYLLAEIKIAQGNIEEADRYLRSLEKSVDPEEYEDYIKDCANLYVDYNINEKAYEWMMRSKGDDSTDFKELMARTLFGMGKYKDSERIFNELIDRNPYSTTYWNALASTQLMNEDYNNAITSSEYAIAIAPNDPEGIASKANGLFRIGNYPEALKYFQRLEKLVPEDNFVLLNIGVCLVNLGRQQEALQPLERALERGVDDIDILPQLYQELAFCYSALKQPEKALELLDRTEKLPCDHSDMLVIRGHIQLEHGMVKEAQESFQRAMKESENNPSIMLRVIVSLYDNRYLQACYEMFTKFFRVASKYDPDFNKGRAYQALVCFDLGKKEEFYIAVGRAARENPQEARLVLGFLFPEGMDPSEYLNYAVHHYIHFDKLDK